MKMRSQGGLAVESAMRNAMAASPGVGLREASRGRLQCHVSASKSESKSKLSQSELQTHMATLSAKEVEDEMDAMRS